MKTRQHVTLRFQMTTRDEDYTDPEPLWKVKISQLECQNAPNNWWKIKDIARQVWDWEDDEERDVTKSKHSLGKARSRIRKRAVYISNVTCKFRLCNFLAPDGCLQYFTELKGSFESFNYNKGMGHYMGNLNYAVCFKRYQDTCGIRYDREKKQHKC